MCRIIILSVLFSVVFSDFSLGQFKGDTDNADKATVIYVFDPICGWCYGFSSVITEFFKKNKEEYNFQVVSGGMMTGSRIGTINDVAPFIKTGYRKVENTTGVQFGRAYLKKMEIGDIVLNSIPPSIALAVFEEKFPDRTIEFAGELQKAIYFDGVEPENIEAYADYAVKLGYPSKSDFLENLKKEKYAGIAQMHFDKAKSLKVNSYPTVLVEKGGQYKIVSSGYIDYDNFERKIAQALK